MHVAQLIIIFKFVDRAIIDRGIRNTLNKIQTAYKFFSSHKRQDVLRDMQSQNEVDRVRSVKSHCDTCRSFWLTTVRDLRATLDSDHSVYQSLIIIDENDHSVHGRCRPAGEFITNIQFHLLS